MITILLRSNFLFSQQKISGKITDDLQYNLNTVLVINITKNIRSLSDSSGDFSIEADENDEVRFVKENYYRMDKVIRKESLNSQINIVLMRVETLIPEVKIQYKPSGNLHKDNKHLGDSRKLADLKSSMEDYIKAPMSAPVPKSEVPKTFQGHDFSAGQVNLINVIGEAFRLIKKASAPKITAPNFVETQEFLNRVKNEVDLNFLRKYGMNEERIDHFLYYAERVNHLSKKFRKDFKPLEVEYELKVTFVEYSKLNQLSNP
ncbi:hypothetical protein CHRY9390_00995 [Chryseobacterium aquaeductus]|uniref:Carboxypeptidase regulatory-like domain-containing protein n=1 Tax=Chryseobacterium aquaeductus TaxID=2675056 RepID=A0A9N8MFN2_9FLAO|nr:hypothetical protein [Chryseobacterium aquaeductus]CAA7330333.1 hypothetical protein CHRY9390_00995 [Chryseobacterium potabilaquae]CAD7802902.1 hypothetical protein CHRY9390_00995 [Chryseobacterium aquaeductus]